METWCHFAWREKTWWGRVVGREIQLVQGSPFDKVKDTTDWVSLEEIEILPPAKPSKIVAVGLNYRDHAEEVKLKLPEEPLLFLKPSTAVIPHGGSIKIPSMSKRVDYEGELGVVIGKVAKDISEDMADEYILGYTCFNDVTARDLQYRDKQWTRAKSFDTFAPFGPYLVRGIDPSNLALKTELNGRIVQSTRTNQLIFSVPTLVSFISRVMTLLPGDVIATGTTSGIGPMKAGDEVRVTIEKVGTLINRVEEG